jgi:carbon starvation protein
LAAEPPAPGKPPAYMAFWTLFGTSNQLLAALTLLGITVWLKRSGRAYWFTLAPMLFVMAITLWSLIGQAKGFFGAIRDVKTGALMAAPLANGIVAVLLGGLAVFLVVEAARVLGRPKRSLDATTTV